MKKQLLTTLLLQMSVVGMLVLSPSKVYAAHNVYYVATNGSDSNAGTKEAPFATFGKAYSTFVAGDTIYFRGGTYSITESEIMTAATTLDASHYCYTFDLTSKGGNSGALTVIAGYPGERPVFDFSNVKPACRIVAFRMHTSYYHLKNFEITGVQATCHGHYQSIAIYNDNANNSIVENIAMHHNKSIGYYATKGADNLVKNCDAYCNFDDYSAFKTDADYDNYLSTGEVKNVSETLGGNSDGFGFHATSTSATGNKFVGCRAWWNADDGYDCINSQTAVTWEDCWAFYNGFEPNGNTGRGDGNGFKAGGYGMSTPCSGYAKDASGNPVIPKNVIKNCVAYYNRANGFYANHHLGGNLWQNNTAMYNAANYSMVNRELATIATAATDVPGYGHILKNNVSYNPRVNGADWTNVDYNQCTFDNNAVATSNMFVDCTRPSDMSAIALTGARQADGSLPEVKFLAAKASSSLFKNQQGALFEDMGDYISTNTFLKWDQMSSWTTVHNEGKFEIGCTNNTAYDRVIVSSLTFTDATENIPFTYCNKELCGNPKGSDSRTITFKVSGPCTIEIFASKSNNTSTSTTPALNIQSGIYDSSVAPLVSQNLTYDTISKVTYEYTGTGVSDLFTVYSASAPSNLYGIRVTFTPSAIKGITENKTSDPQQQKAVKTFVNGKLVIRKADGSLYNIAGAKM